VISTTDFKKGKKFLYRGDPYEVVSTQWVKPGKGGAYIKTKMRNLISGAIHEETFRSGEKMPTPDLKYKDMQYLYHDGEFYQFMDQDNYDQVALTDIQLADVKDYLKEQVVYTTLYFEDKPIQVTPPIFMELEIVETMPGVRGDTAQGGATKPATLETGKVVQIPLFVEQGESIKVDTRDGIYVERVKK
jgi:elongation factor P